MKIDRYMVNLFFEIKRGLPLDQQRNMLISNSEIGEIMVNLYQKTNDENIRLLTKVFLKRAGEEWLKQAESKKTNSPLLNKLFNNTSAKVMIKKNSSQRIYRGQIVED